MPSNSHSTYETEKVLCKIEQEKQQARILIVAAIEESWVEYANAMGLVFHEYNTPESRQIANMKDLRSALKQLTNSNKLAALYFITGYTRDVLHSHVLWGETHQTAVEDYVMETMNATFATSRTEMQNGHKTCVGQLYGQLYNQKKHKLHRAILPAHIALAVGRHGVPKPNHWKRPKEVYFVLTTQTNTTDDTARVESKMVRAN
jgi:hypothetical protein